MTRSLHERPFFVPLAGSGGRLSQYVFHSASENDVSGSAAYVESL